MFLINRDENSIQKAKKMSFSEGGYTERTHLQEWILKNPECLDGESLLIITKEFAGFSGTKERLDILALDKEGDLVLIENKLDDSGRDVTWQALKYASYCSTLEKEQIKKIYQQYLVNRGKSEDAELKITEFLGYEDFQEVKINEGLKQRIILVAANFRDEVKSAVTWLLKHNLRIQCFETSLFESDGKHFIIFNQILPVKEPSIVRLEKKIDQEVKKREVSRVVNSQKSEFLERVRSRCPWLNTDDRNSNLRGETEIRQVQHHLVLTESKVRFGLTMVDRDDVYNELFNSKNEVNKKFQMTWLSSKENNSKRSRIEHEEEFDYSDKERWDQQTEYIVSQLGMMRAALREPLERAIKKFKK
jgi:hypothetical protein